MYIYFVSYHYTFGVGNIEISVSERITTYNIVKEIEKKIASDIGVGNVVISNFILLQEEVEE